MKYKEARAIFTIGIIVLIAFHPMNVEGEVEIGDRIYYFVEINSEEHTNTNVILTQVSWLGNLTVERYTTIMIEITEIDSNKVLGTWDYATEYDLEDIRFMLNNSNYEAPKEMVDITELIIWTTKPREVDWNTRVSLLNGTTTAENYTIRAAYYESINRYQETHTSGEATWSYFIDTNTGILDMLSTRGNQTTLGVDNASVNSIQIKQTFRFNYKPKYLYTGVFLLGQILITTVLIGLIFLVSTRYSKKEKALGQ